MSDTTIVSLFETWDSVASLLNPIQPTEAGTTALDGALTSLGVHGAKFGSDTPRDCVFIDTTGFTKVSSSSGIGCDSWIFRLSKHKESIRSSGDLHAPS